MRLMFTYTLYKPSLLGPAAPLAPVRLYLQIVAAGLAFEGAHICPIVLAEGIGAALEGIGASD
jgi:hypothetical protein